MHDFCVNEDPSECYHEMLNTLSQPASVSELTKNAVLDASPNGLQTDHIHMPTPTRAVLQPRLLPIIAHCAVCSTEGFRRPWCDCQYSVKHDAVYSLVAL